MRFFCWLESALTSNQAVSESTAANKLKEFRSQGKNYVGLSFDTISASGPNAAIIHYKPSAELSRSLSLDEIYLCDSGAQYLYVPFAGLV